MLHEFVANHHDAIRARTAEKLRTRNWPASANELESGVPVFLTQLVDTLRSEDTETPFSPTAIRTVAARHGRELLDLGFDVSQVVHVYGDVCQAITELALEQQAPIAIEEFHILNRCLDTAIAEAVTEHVRITAQRTGTNEVERLEQVANELRHSLNTALTRLKRFITDRRRRAEELARLRQLSGQLLQADDGDRRQVAHELTENIVQCLVALRLSLSVARDSDVNMGPETRQTITDGLSLLETCCSNISTMSQVLHPSLLAPFGLEPAIAAYVKSFVLRTGIEVSVDIPQSVGRLRDDAELALFRIMQEALLHVHESRRAKAAVRMFRDARAVGLEVMDESGESPLERQPDEHGASDAGIVAMGGRIRILGGRLTVTRAGTRTTVLAVLPLLSQQHLPGES